jgi:hypothetical protein
MQRNLPLLISEDASSEEAQIAIQKQADATNKALQLLREEKILVFLQAVKEKNVERVIDQFFLLFTMVQWIAKKTPAEMIRQTYINHNIDLYDVDLKSAIQFLSHQDEFIEMRYDLRKENMTILNNHITQRQVQALQEIFASEIGQRRLLEHKMGKATVQAFIQCIANRFRLDLSHLSAPDGTTASSRVDGTSDRSSDRSSGRPNSSALKKFLIAISPRPKRKASPHEESHKQAESPKQSHSPKNELLSARARSVSAPDSFEPSPSLPSPTSPQLTRTSAPELHVGTQAPDSPISLSSSQEVLFSKSRHGSSPKRSSSAPRGRSKPHLSVPGR